MVNDMFFSVKIDSVTIGGVKESDLVRVIRSGLDVKPREYFVCWLESKPETECYPETIVETVKSILKSQETVIVHRNKRIVTVKLDHGTDGE